MNQQVTHNKINSAVRFLGIKYPLFQVTRTIGSSEQAKMANTEFRDIVKKRRKELAKTHHPDAGGDAEKMKQINAASDFLLAVKISYVPPPPPQQFVFSFGWGGPVDGSTTNSYTYYTGS